MTARVIDRGRKNQRILCQPQYHPWPVENQVAVIYAGVNGLLEDLEVSQVNEFETEFIQQLKMKNQEDVLDVLKSGKLTDEVQQKLNQTAREVVGRIASVKK